MTSVPTDATNAPANVVRFFAKTSGARRDASAHTSSVAMHARRCVIISVAVTELLSVSCSQNAPENAMVFHAFQHPMPM